MLSSHGTAQSMRLTVATAGIFEGLGARSTTAALGFGRFWRNVRTLHDPVADERREVGAFLLRDELPEPTWYS